MNCGHKTVCFSCVAPLGSAIAFKKMLFGIKPANAGGGVKPRASALGGECVRLRAHEVGHRPASVAHFVGL